MKNQILIKHTLLLAVVAAVGILSSCSKDEPKDTEDNSHAMEMLQSVKNKYWQSYKATMVNKYGEEMSLEEAWGRYGMKTSGSFFYGLYITDDKIRDFYYEGKYYYRDIPYANIDADGRIIYNTGASNMRILSAEPDKLVIAEGEGKSWPDPDADSSEGTVYQEGAYTKVVYIPATGWILEQFKNAGTW